MAGNRGIGRALMLVTQLSINMLVPVFLCLFIGYQLDRFFHTQWLTLVFLLLGCLAALRSMYITLKPLLKGEREAQDEVYQKQFDERYKKSE